MGTDYFAGLEDDSDFAPTSNKVRAVDPAADGRANAHIANGGESTTACTRCVRGFWKGMRKFPCRSCGGTGKVTKATANRQVGYRKAEETKARNFLEWRQANRALIDGINRHGWNRILTSMADQLADRRVLSEKQVELAERIIREADERDAKRAEERRADAKAREVAVDMSAIDAMFETAKGNGLKNPRFVAAGFTLSLAKATSTNAGAVYIKRSGEYLGKIMNGAFMPVRTAGDEVRAELLKIAADPKGYAVSFGRATCTCCCCGRELTDPASVAAGIGPICEANWF